MKKIIFVLAISLFPIFTISNANAKVCGMQMTSRTNHKTGHTSIRYVYKCSKY